MELVSDLLKILERQSEIVESMANGNDDLVSKNIIKSEGSTFDSGKGNKVKPKLDSKEKSRATEISSIFITKWFEEQDKRTKDTSLETKIAKPKKDEVPKVTQGMGGLGGGKGKGEKESNSIWGWVTAAVTGFLTAKLSKLKESLKKALKKTFGKVWGGIKSAFTNAYQSIKNGAKKAADSIKRLGSGIKSFFGKISSSIKRFASSVAKKVNSVFSSIRSSKAFTAVEEAFGSAKKAVSEIFSSLKSKITDVASNVADKAKSLLNQSAIGRSALKLGGKAVGAAKSAAGWIAGKAKAGVELAKKGTSIAVSGVKKAGKAVASGAKKVVEMTGSKAKGIITSVASKAIGKSGGMMKMMGKLAKIPIIGPIIEGLFTAYDIKQYKNRYAKGEMTLDQLQQESGKRVITGVGGALGSVAGTALAGTLGSVVPGAGTALGAIVGAIGGDLAGRFLAGIVTDYLIPPKYTKTIGAFVTGTPPPKNEMQDFIIKDGRVHSFSNKDEVLGMKTGGAVDQLLKESVRSQNNTQLMLVNDNPVISRLYDANVLSNRYLEIIANNTSKMVNGVTKSTAPAPDANAIKNIAKQSSGGQSGQTSPRIPIRNNRTGYGSSSYSLQAGH